jgi:hypothetical protein
MAAMAGVGAGGLVGGIAGALIGMGIPEYEANRYEGRIKEGGILLSVHADDRDWKNKGKEILERTGAEDIGYKGESAADSDETDRPYSKETGTAGLRTGYGGADYKRTGEPVKHTTTDPLNSKIKDPKCHK